ncbi:MAG: helix-turn-helix domain-containing protein [Lentisphaerae bacterium]|jgi:excisionase family DNA binding protein|nr:helix-turn-helix domain-containing protein [Lentisphaerota bacterium]MBT4820254.1 helix-turn-helix domain-containing protein [Lentisphaerota bacterium]MBT5606012.1 helix-turn-helix domain-containing protein [Lentisphaerota bacterium]MBT7058599.1 helix-turn-helix domain-containing protein [Lentisphaerota bacterium]MBT7845451.1 helix-turn-helix domain-containing protein [Lentisphaerota bacterium]
MASATKQILDTIFASSDYGLDDYLRDLGLKSPEAEPEKLARQRLLTNKQACEYLQISPTTLWRLVKQRRIKTVNLRGRARYDVQELDRFIRRSQR